MPSPLTADERRALSNIALVAGLLAVVLGTVAFSWAYQRVHADNARSWGYGLGVIALMGGPLLLFASALLWPRRRDRAAR